MSPVGTPIDSSHLSSPLHDFDPSPSSESIPPPTPETLLHHQLSVLRNLDLSGTKDLPQNPSREGTRLGVKGVNILSLLRGMKYSDEHPVFLFVPAPGRFADPLHLSSPGRRRTGGLGSVSGLDWDVQVLQDEPIVVRTRAHLLVSDRHDLHPPELGGESVDPFHGLGQSSPRTRDHGGQGVPIPWTDRGYGRWTDTSKSFIYGSRSWVGGTGC